MSQDRVKIRPIAGPGTNDHRQMGRSAPAWLLCACVAIAGAGLPRQAHAGWDSFLDQLEENITDRANEQSDKMLDRIEKLAEPTEEAQEPAAAPPPAPAPSPNPAPSDSQPSAAPQPVLNGQAATVRQVQQMLNGLGYDAGAADGAYGGHTAQALAAFQKDHGLPPSGDITSATFAAVSKAWEARTPQVAAPAAPQPAPQPAAPASAGTTPGSVAAAPAASTDAVPADGYLLSLHALRSQPELLDEKRLLHMTTKQVLSDQRAYKLAASDVVATVGNSRQEPFFDLQEVKGQNPGFAAEELAPKMRHYVQQLAAQAPKRLWVGHRIGGMTYDSERQMLRFTCCYIRPELAGRFELLQPPTYYGYGVNLQGRSQRFSEPASGTADAAIDARAVYDVEANLPDDVPGDHASAIDDSALRQFPMVLILAFDRVLELDGIPMPRDRAKQIGNGVRSRIVFTVEGAAQGRDKLALLARVEEVQMIAPDGTELARFPAEAFPLATARAAEIEAAAAAAAEAKKAAALAKQQQEAAAKAAAAAAEKAAGEAAVAAALEALKDGPYGPDMIGIRLGMSFDEAKALIREHMDVGWVLAGRPVTDPETGVREPMTSERIFISVDLGETVAIIDEPPAATGTVLGAWRMLMLPVPPPSMDEIGALLEEKYGPPARRPGSKRSWMWGESVTKDDACQRHSGSSRHDLAFVEGTEDDRPLRSATNFARALGFRLNYSDLRHDPANATRYAECSLVVEVQYLGDRLTTYLFDNRVYAAHFAKSIEMLRSASAAEDEDEEAVQF